MKWPQVPQHISVCSFELLSSCDNILVSPSRSCCLCCNCWRLSHSCRHLEATVRRRICCGSSRRRVAVWWRYRLMSSSLTSEYALVRRTWLASVNYFPSLLRLLLTLLILLHTQKVFFLPPSHFNFFTSFGVSFPRSTLVSCRKIIFLSLLLASLFLIYLVFPPSTAEKNGKRERKNLYSFAKHNLWFWCSNKSTVGRQIIMGCVGVLRYLLEKFFHGRFYCES